MKVLLSQESVEITDPPIARFVFSDTRFSVVWLVLRLYMGWQWIDAASHKIFEPKWVVTGEALKAYWTNALKLEPKAVITFDWYRTFIQYLVDTQSYTWFAKLVAYGELLIGLGLIVGAFTGVAAFFGGFMNWNFMMAGSASSNPWLFLLAVLVMLAWKTAGYWGLDRYLLPMLGTPWRPAFSRHPATVSVRS
jgi:thiosulfate dehydrogenase [quinone] large subunit